MVEAQASLPVKEGRPWLDDNSWLGLGLHSNHSWEYRETFYGRSDRGSLGTGLLYGSLWQIPMNSSS